MVSVFVGLFPFSRGRTFSWPGSLTFYTFSMEIQTSNVHVVIEYINYDGGAQILDFHKDFLDAYSSNIGV